MTTSNNQEKKCECYCHKKDAHSCDYGNGICAMCDKPSRSPDSKKCEMKNNNGVNPCSIIHPGVSHEQFAPYETPTGLSSPSVEEDWEKKWDTFMTKFVFKEENVKDFIRSLLSQARTEAGKGFEKERILFRKHQIEDMERARTEATTKERERILKELKAWVKSEPSITGIGLLNIFWNSLTEATKDI